MKVESETSLVYLEGGPKKAEVKKPESEAKKEGTSIYREIVGLL